MSIAAPTSGPVGIPQTIAVTVTGNDPTGMVDLFINGFVAGVATLSNGQATITIGNLAVGAHVATVHYRGDAKNEPTLRVVALTVTEPATQSPTSVAILYTSSVDARSSMSMTVYVSESAGAVGANRDVSVTVRRASDGSTVFSADLTTDRDGAANLAVPPQEVGTYNITAAAAPTTSHASGSRSVVYTVTPIVTTTTLAISPLAQNGSRIAYTDTTYTATVTPAMAGIPVNFLTMGGFPPRSQIMGSAVTDEAGVATMTARTGGVTFLPSIISAKVETTDPNIFSSTSPPQQFGVSPRVVNATVNAPSEAPLGGTAIVDVTLPDAPAEMTDAEVKVHRGGDVITSQRIANHDGVLSTNDLVIPSPVAAGPENLTVTVTPPSFSMVMNPPTHVIAIDWTRAAHTIDIDVFQSVDAMTPMPIAAVITDAAGNAVSGRDVTMTVTPVDGTAPLFTADLTTGAEGAAAAMVPALPVGSYRIDVTASETDTLAAVSQSQTYDVVPIEPAVTVTPPATVVHGSALSITATVDGDNPTGIVEFVDGQTVLGTATLASGEATVSINTLTAGEHTIVARYLGDDRHAAASASAIATVAPWTSVVTADLSTDAATVGDTVTLDVAVTLVDPTITTMARALGAAVQASGTVELLIDGDVVGAPVALVDGAGTLVVPSAHAGAVSVAARFVPADSSMTTATSEAHTVTITAAPAPTPKPTTEPSVSPSAPVATPKPALAATGAAEPHGFALAAALLIGGLALAVGRMTRKQRP